MDKGAGACQVVTRDLRRPPLLSSVTRNVTRRSSNAFYPDFAYRVDVKRKCLQVLSVVGPTKFVQGEQVEGSSCFNKLRAEGEAKCIEEYSMKLGYRYPNTNPSTFYFPAVFECVRKEEATLGEDERIDMKPEVKWVNPFPFDTGAEALVMSLARHASEWIAYFQRNISKLHMSFSDHTKLSLVLQLDVITCESWTTRVPKMPHDVRFGYDSMKDQEASKRQKGFRFRKDRLKWIAEFNPPGKRNNKISLGEYDSLDEAARAADAGKFYYGSKKPSYNFGDSPLLLQQGPSPLANDKDAIRKWARDFAKLTTNVSSPSTSMSIGGGLPAPYETSGYDISIPMPFNSTVQQQHVLSSTPMCNLLEAFPRIGVVEGDLQMQDYDSCSDLSLPDVSQHMTSRDTFNLVDQECTGMIVSQGTEQVACPEEVLFSNFPLPDVEIWSSPPLLQSPLLRTSSDGNWVSDDLFQYLSSPANPSFNSFGRLGFDV
ncbi:uncharacterized protein [Physcomitrium patens]|nr:uncharacterized protein LOC112279664 [Physcomitrium patens]XP_024370074.1 uncharacterized protein LOC112279664 [Physcomitrium patens]|eukprot:XP_024370073.1 uncharacterized protein LOC112279664 [Physcomitrella patens]